MSIVGKTEPNIRLSAILLQVQVGRLAWCIYAQCQVEDAKNFVADSTPWARARNPSLHGPKPSSWPAGNVGKVLSSDSEMEPSLRPSLLTQSPEFLVPPGNWCYSLKKKKKKESASDCSNVSFNVIFVHKGRTVCKCRLLVPETNSASDKAETQGPGHVVRVRPRSHPFSRPRLPWPRGLN